ncbi:MAG: DUF192 domain-containing protein [Elusimicrobia bacterium]|nr:DUF192 domain-containing protein [Elusimicrobiota bacterium]
MMIFILLAALAPPAAAAAPACRPQTAAKHAVLTLPSGRTLRVDVVDAPATREIGLMCRTKLPKDYGMLFVFPREMSLQFWMKNTFVPLDLLWIGADKRVTAVHSRLPASRLDTPEDRVARASGLGQYVLELPSGAAARHKLKEGDALRFSVPIPDR